MILEGFVMKVGVVEKPGTLKLAEREAPAVSLSDDVLIRVKRVGICGSDMHIFHGKNPFATYPRVWGHEFVGEVAAAGPEAAVSPGDHVVAEPIAYCGECYACRQGRGNVCQNLKVSGVHVDGGCQEYIVLPAKQVHKVPSDIPWDSAVLIEPFTIGAQASLRGRVQRGDIVLVYGAGTIGLTVMQFAKFNGGTVIITDIVDDKLAFAAATGADYIINAAQENVFDRVMQITGGMGANVTIDAVCSKQSFEDALLVTSAAGRVVEMSFNETASEIAPLHITKKELDVCGSRLQTARFPVVIDALKRGALKLDGFITATYPLSRMEEAFAYVDANGPRVRKVLIDMEQ